MTVITMPKTGEIRGIRDNRQHLFRYIWRACADCKKHSWVRLEGGQPSSQRCHQCIGIEKRGIPLKNGRHKDGAGYVRILLPQNSFFQPMSLGGGYILEHRLIMAQHLRRCLLPWEVIHHRNGIKDDNRLENLELLSTSRQHLPDMLIKAHIKQQDKRIANLEARVTLLEAEKVLLQSEREVHEVRF